MSSAVFGNDEHAGYSCVRPTDASQRPKSRFVKGDEPHVDALAVERSWFNRFPACSRAMRAAAKTSLAKSSDGSIVLGRAIAVSGRLAARSPKAPAIEHDDWGAVRHHRGQDEQSEVLEGSASTRFGSRDARPRSQHYYQPVSFDFRTGYLNRHCDHSTSGKALGAPAGV